jgi:hypothetical protein
VRTPGTLARLLRLHIWTATGTSFIAFLQVVLYFWKGTTWGVTEWIVPRVAGTTPEPSPFAIYLLSSIVILAVLVHKQNIVLFSKTHMMIHLLVQLTALILTASVAGWLILVFIVSVVLLTSKGVIARWQISPLLLLMGEVDPKNCTGG